MSTCDLWLENPNATNAASMFNGGYYRRAHKITVPNKTVCMFGVPLRKVGNPTGTLYARIRKVSDDSIIETSADTVDVSTLTTSFVWYYFDFASLVNEEVRLHVEFNGGDGSNYVQTAWATSVIDGIYSYAGAGAWTDSAANDLTCKIYCLSEALPEGQPYISRVQHVSGMQTFNPIH